jgi:hypothetical protein
LGLNSYFEVVTTSAELGYRNLERSLFEDFRGIKG